MRTTTGCVSRAPVLQLASAPVPRASLKILAYSEQERGVVVHTRLSDNGEVAATRAGFLRRRVGEATQNPATRSSIERPGLTETFKWSPDGGYWLADLHL